MCKKKSVCAIERVSDQKKAPVALSQSRKMVENIKIGLKRVAVGAFGASPISKCTIFEPDSFITAKFCQDLRSDDL